jgi:hypothetical protein
MVLRNRYLEIDRGGKKRMDQADVPVHSADTSQTEK